MGLKVLHIQMQSRAEKTEIAADCGNKYADSSLGFRSKAHIDLEATLCHLQLAI